MVDFDFDPAVIQSRKVFSVLLLNNSVSFTMFLREGTISANRFPIGARASVREYKS